MLLITYFYSNYDHLPEHLSFDKFKGVDHTFHFICLDADKKEMIQILRTRYKKIIIVNFKKFTIQLCKASKQFLWTWIFTIRTFIMRAWFTNTEIVIDHFHIVQMLTHSLNSLSVQAMKKFKKGQKRILIHKISRGSVFQETPMARENSSA